MKKATLLLAMFFLAIGWVYAHNGVYILSKTKSLTNGQISKSEIYLGETKMLVRNSGANNSTFIFDSMKEEVVYIDHGRKQYYQFDKPTLLQLKTTIKTMAQVMKQFATNIPDEQLAKLDKILNPSRGAMMTYKKSDQNHKVGKWSTKGYEALKGSDKILDFYIASFSTIKIDQKDFEIMKVMMQFVQNNLQEVVAMLPMDGPFSQLSFDETSPMLKDGIPLKTITYENGLATNENLVTTIKKQFFSESQFGVPEGYQRQYIDMQSIGG